MKASLHGLVSALVVTLALAGVARSAPTTTATQTLDTVVAYTPKTALDMAFNDSDATLPFTDLGTRGTAFSTCTLTATRGLFCLDGKAVRNWPVPAKPETSTTLFSCDNPALGLDAKRSNGCSALTVDLAGAVWIAGLKSNNSHSIFKVVKGACAAGFVSLGNGWCAKEFYSGRPVVVDLVSIDGQAALAYGATGVIGIEERKNSVFFPAPAGDVPTAPVVLANSRDWGLSGSELLQEVALLQTGSAGSKVSTLLATTSNGRLLAKATSGAASKVFDIPGARGAAGTCSTAPAQFGVRASSTSGVVYVSDSVACVVHALAPTVGAVITLQRQETLDTGTNPVIGLTIAPGISIDLVRCATSCTLVNDSEAAPAAKLSSIDLVKNTPSGATVFQIKGIPDCRYVGSLSAADRTLCYGTPGVVANGQGQLLDLAAALSQYPPEALYLNATPLLPAEATASYLGGALPPLLLQPQFRAKTTGGSVFQALFVVTQEGVRFTDTFGGEFKVDALESGLPVPGYDRCTINSGYTPLATLLKWDVSTTVSEVFTSIDGRYQDMLWNTGCGSILISGARLSLIPYDLEVSPRVYDPATNQSRDEPAVFGILLRKLYSDLGKAQSQLACKRVDPVVAGAQNATAPPVGNAACNSLTSSWTGGEPKLEKCISAAYFPKQSGGDENCQAFLSALSNFEKAIPASTPANDGANRVGELKIRVAVIRHVYSSRFVPSIPPNGFGG